MFCLIHQLHVARTVLNRKRQNLQEEMEASVHVQEAAEINQEGAYPVLAQRHGVDRYRLPF